MPTESDALGGDEIPAHATGGIIRDVRRKIEGDADAGSLWSAARSASRSRHQGSASADRRSTHCTPRWSAIGRGKARAPYGSAARCRIATPATAERFLGLGHGVSTRLICWCHSWIVPLRSWTLQQLIARSSLSMMHPPIVRRRSLRPMRQENPEVPGGAACDLI